ncbi:MAG: hypothetical protein Q7J68_02100 [Thermoplasmata archaeon]|nr:hypothetical protein [Thermoplasmata archaeon]
MLNYEVLRERKPYRRDIYHELERIEQRGRRQKEARKQKKAAFLKFLGFNGSKATNTA